MMGYQLNYIRQVTKLEYRTDCRFFSIVRSERLDQGGLVTGQGTSGLTGLTLSNCAVVHRNPTPMEPTRAAPHGTESARTERNSLAKFHT